ncbi:hypothetical protein HPB51_008834 [Rhipicephalus microplus]|uniref:Uncharacterized protein n=1 Tax=Rhipicephalus microplus TaxID=6941 RepID=A0A9J6ESZ3_RHIMP|nr:hypothetical protein HPB51_008834 [Rhipicephalus microplus]
MQFLTNSSAVKVTRLLSVALECLAFTVEKIDLVQADATKLRSYLDNLAPFLRDPNLSAHALKQALAVCLTFVCVIFSSASQYFDWRACGALCSFGESLQRQLVSTEPQFVEAALDSFGGIGNDADVFARRSAASTLRTWLTRDCLGLRSRHRSALQRCASTMLCLDLDCEVQLAGLSIWKTLLGESLGASSAVSDSTVKEILKDADTAGFGTSMKKVMACDADQEVRKDAQAFMRQLWTRLHDQCLLPEKSRVMGRTQDEVDASDGKPDHSAEAGAPMECCDNTSTVDRLAAMEEVLDLGVSECLQRKLKLPENIRKPAAPPTTCTLKSELVDTTELLARLSARGTFRNCDVEHVTEDFHSGDSLLEDILAAAASDHCDRDCY